MENVTGLLWKRGTQFHKIGGGLLKVLLCGLIVVLLVTIIAILGYGTDALLYVFTFNSGMGYVDFLMGAGLLAIIIGSIGLPLYFNGLHYLGLAQIAQNTGSARN